MISGAIFAADYYFCERTLLTTDGGLNWVHVNIPELPQEDDLHWAEVADFSLVDENYVLTIRYETLETEYSYAKYKFSISIWLLKTNFSFSKDVSLVTKLHILSNNGLHALLFEINEGNTIIGLKI